MHKIILPQRFVTHTCTDCGFPQQCSPTAWPSFQGRRDGTYQSLSAPHFQSSPTSLLATHPPHHGRAARLSCCASLQPKGIVLFPFPSSPGGSSALRRDGPSGARTRLCSRAAPTAALSRPCPGRRGGRASGSDSWAAGGPRLEEHPVLCWVVGSGTRSPEVLASLLPALSLLEPSCPWSQG